MSIILRLPEEIQEEVILKMPVKSIFTCKCVCKLWCNLISSSESVRDHLSLACSNTNLTSFIFLNKSSLCYVEYDLENDEQLCPKLTEELFNLARLGDLTGEENINLVGSCNGLVCLTTKINNYLSDHVYVCNPITREFVQLPRLVQNSKDYKDAGFRSIFYGFGYLPSSDEYKVVRISYKLDSRNIMCTSGDVHVYTLGEGKGWRDRGHIQVNNFSKSDFQSIFVDGALYWVECGFPEIVVFDLTYEEFYMLPRPPRLFSDWGHFYMVVLGRQLCFFQATTESSSNIWLLKKKMDNNSDGKKQDIEGKHSSWIWSKESTVTMRGIQRYKPLTITKKGDILLLYKEKWNQEKNEVVVRYDPKTSNSKEIGDLGLPLPLPCYRKAVIHVNGYISLKSIGEQTVFARL